MTYLITYDLIKPGQNYQQLYDEIKSLGNWCHPLDSNWFVVSNLSAAQIRDQLSSIDATDKLLVSKVSAPGAWTGFSSEVNTWLKENL